MKNILLTVMALMAIIPTSLAQCVLEAVSLENRVTSSDLIIEAKIVDQVSFINETDEHIYTANYLNIIKVFKGNVTDEEVILISQGGVVGNNGETVHPSIHVEKDMMGVFFLYTSDVIGDNSLKNYKPYSGPQACIYYDLARGSANDAFTTYPSIENDVYTQLTTLLGSNFKTMKKIDLPSRANNKAATTITDFFPKTVNAGIKMQLTIIGKEFNNTQGTGYVQFSNASTGAAFVSPKSTEYIKWSDTMIVVQVPHRAGTGIVSVQQNGLGITSGLTINFAQLNFDNRGRMIPAFHKDNDGNGKFEWEMSNAFHGNNGARNSFERAMTNWSDNTCINWFNGPATIRNQDREDGVNNVRWGNSGELETGVLAITRNYWTYCDGNTAWPKEIDLTFDPDKNWNVSSNNPSFSQYDIESIAVHELGHAHELGHVIDFDNFMHATIGAGDVKRNLINGNIDAGLYIMKYSASSFLCGPAPMTGTAGCSLPIGLQENKDDIAISVFPNPFSDILNIDNSAGMEGVIEMYSAMGERVALITISADQPMVSWEVPSKFSEGLYFLKSQSSGQLIGKVLLSR